MKWRVLAMVGVVLVCYLFRYFPLENTYMRFDTPEAAFQYTSNSKILRTVEGKESCIVFYQSSQGTSWAAIRKTENGYKLPEVNVVLPQSEGENDLSALPEFCLRCDYTVQKYRNTNDYYLFITATIDDKNSTFEDNRGEEVPCVFDPSGYSHMVIICVPFDGYPQNYVLKANGEEILRLE